MPIKDDIKNYLTNINFKIINFERELLKINPMNENTLENKKELEEHSITCQYKKIKCKYCEKEIKQIDFNKHETKECQGLMECPFCKLPMKRKTFLSNHADSNTNNIKCLKTKVDYYIKECKKYKDELKKLQASSKKEVDDIKKGFDTELDELKEKYKKLIKNGKIIKFK